MTTFTSRNLDFNFIAGKKKKDIISTIREGSKKKLRNLILNIDLDNSFLVDDEKLLEENTGKTILHHACLLGQKKIVQYLLHEGATNVPEFNCSIRSDKLLTPLDDSILKGHYEISNIIMNYKGLNAVVNSNLVKEEDIEKLNIWKEEREKQKAKRNNELCQMLRGMNLINETDKKIENDPIYARAMQHNESISNKRKKDSDNTCETPESSLEYERD